MEPGTIALIVGLAVGGLVVVGGAFVCGGLLVFSWFMDVVHKAMR